MDSKEMLEVTAEIVTGFNVNIDTIHSVDIDFSSEGELLEKIETDRDLHSVLSYCANNGENHEVSYTDFGIHGGEDHIGGQGGIISNFMANTGNSAILYTPYLSGEVAELLEENVLYPVESEDGFVLKSVRDAVNSKRTKHNHIFEFDSGKTGRLILSDSLKGYGPYFPGYLEEELGMLEGNVDCFILSGFHDADGNVEAKFDKIRRQLSRISKPVHLEYVHDPETSEKVVDRLVPEADSLGMDETELKMLCEMKDIDCPEEPNFGEAFAAVKELRDKLELDRIHLHTYSYHLTVVPEDYPASTSQIRESMLYGELAALTSADKGEIPDTEDIEGFDMEGKHLKGVEQLEDFGDFHNLDSFGSEGEAAIDGLKVVGIPVIIHEEPERTVGMGDIISSGAFSTETVLSQDS